MGGREDLPEPGDVGFDALEIVIRAVRIRVAEIGIEAAKVAVNLGQDVFFPEGRCLLHQVSGIFIGGEAGVRPALEFCVRSRCADPKSRRRLPDD